MQRVLLSTTMPQKPSYRQNRYPIKQFDQIYKLQKNEYNCYLKEIEDLGTEYMKMLKSQFHFLSEKNLKDQASSTHKNKIVLKAVYQSLASDVVDKLEIM